MFTTNDSVSSVLRIFTKLIKRLEKIRERQLSRQAELNERASELRRQAADAHTEAQAADKAIVKLSKFMED